MKKLSFPIQSTDPKMHCKVFNKNSGAFEIAKTHKYHPKINHFNVNLHHSHNYITQKEISIHPIDTSNQLDDYLNKSVNHIIMESLHAEVMGW